MGEVCKEILDADTAVTNGWYKLTSVNITDAHIPFQFVMIHVTAYSNRYVVQDLYGTVSTLVHMQRYMRDGVWGEWEYINPPMELGVEYRTTERWLGKPVYVKTLDVGYVGIGMTTKHHNIQMTQCLSCLGFESGNDTMPAKYDDSSIDVYKNIYANNTQIIIYSNTDSNRYTHCTLKYTKD